MYAKMSGLRGLIAVIAGAVIGMAVPAYAANFVLSPVFVTLGRGARSQMVVMTNQENFPLRFQLNAYRWDERPDGQMVLTPTDEVIFFPQLFDLPPHGAQNIRIGAIDPAVESEKTYRLVMHQLKSFEAPKPAGKVQDTTVVTVLTKVSIPVFVEPAAAAAQASISSLNLRNGRLNFTVRNSGNAHFRIKSLLVEGFGAGTQPVFSKTTEGWYVLAGGSRNYELTLSGANCSQANRLRLSVETDHGKLQSELPIGAADCAKN
jgi:fimbrial chaperone protein